MSNDSKLFLEAKRIFREEGIELSDKDIEEIMLALNYFIEAMIG